MSHNTMAARENLAILEEQYQRWRQDPTSVDASWQYFFQGFELAQQQRRAAPARAAGPQPRGLDEPCSQTAVVRIIYIYRLIGHFLAHLDPLHDAPTGHPLLELSEFDVTEADLDRPIDTSQLPTLPYHTLRELLAALRETYCRTIGVEYMHILDTPIRHWLQERMESCRNQPRYSRDKKLWILKRLHYAELFEKFLGARYKGQKRFSLEGAETLIPMLEAIVEKGPGADVQEMVLGMAHRGRLNVLANILRKPYEEIFAQFEENYLPNASAGDGDVKYHLGFSSDRFFPDGHRLHLSLTPNPSHLEAVNPIVEGRTRAKQTLFGDLHRTRGLPLLIHGDAAFAGQGLVTETLNLSQLAGYNTGGTIHIVVNNQIGFTTSPSDARSTLYCTDVAKMLQVPIFHVNGEDPEAAVFVAELALEFRQTFHRDVVIDLVGYRKHGHNEGDEPSFTQPLMYQKIRGRPSVTRIYNDRLIHNGDLSREEADDLQDKFEAKLQAALDEVQTGPAEYPVMHGFEGHWKGLVPVYTHDPVDTGVPWDVLREVSEGLLRLPEGFQPHPIILKGFQRRHQALLERQPVAWPHAELLAFGSLLIEGSPIRMTGQDSRRATFSQRHAVLIDSATAQAFTPLNHLRPDQARLAIYDSPLSEAAVLGFEFGYSLDAPETLVMWEAQFGDFANGAQVIIDQFIASSASKWQRDSGVVMLLPHGHEGQGPEHSSGRVERFLQLCAEDNIQVCMLSTPAQYFHALRRQLKRKFRKPLILMTPKSLLRHELAVSPVEELVSGRFHEILDDATVDSQETRRVLLCSGKVYYDLLEQRTRDDRKDVALIRVEQLYPLNEGLLRRILERYRKAREWVWVQEESQNNGAWFFMEPRLRALGFPVEYVGRDASASPATGSLQVHKREQKELVEAAVRGPAPHLVRAPHVIRGRDDGAAAREKPAPASAGS